MGIEKTIRIINGFFVFIYIDDQQVVLVSDLIRSFPLFYATENDRFLISDSAEIIFEKLSKASIDDISLEEFVYTERFVTGKNTLIKEIKQIQAGEIIYVDL